MKAFFTSLVVKVKPQLHGDWTDPMHTLKVFIGLLDMDPFMAFLLPAQQCFFRVILQNAASSQPLPGKIFNPVGQSISFKLPALLFPLSSYSNKAR